MESLMTLLMLLYPLPGLLAVVRRVRGAGWILLNNLVLGWTVIFWLIALRSALHDEPRYESCES